MYAKYEEKIDELIERMTLDEKIGQLNQMPWPKTPQVLEQYKEMIAKGEIGSIILTGSATSGNEGYHCLNVDMYNEIQKIAVENSPNHIPMIFGFDVVHGHQTVLPIALASAAAFNTDLLEQCYRDVAKEAAADGIHWTFSPMVDMGRDPRWGRIAEGPGEDPYVGAKFAEAAVKGFQGECLSDEDSLVACAKHYIGYGASEGGRDYHRTEISDYTLYNNYLPAFKSAIDAGVGTVMSSFNDINGEPVSSSKKYLTEILRDKLGFKGYVVTDWGAVRQLQHQGVAQNDKESAKLSIEAGVDMDMCTCCFSDNLKQLLYDGEITEEVIDVAVRRVLRIKFAKGLMEQPYTRKRKVDRTLHMERARELSAESMVLLKNDGVLPLKKSTKIALLGPFVKERRSLLGTWALSFILEETPSLYDAMVEKIGADHILLELDETGLCDTSVVTASKADVVVLALGESWRSTGESHSVSDISLSVSQRELIRKMRTTGKKVVGVFFCGRPIAMDGLAEELDAILYAWHGGTQTANSACDILFGDTIPSGKTPVTFPRNTGQIPIYYNVTSSGRPVNGYYGENHQPSYNDCLPTPYYPFGYGLSYTQFAYSEPTVDKDTVPLEKLHKGEIFRVSVEVENVGNYDGKEVVQLYVYDPYASVMRPLKLLKGFEKVTIRKSEKVKVQFEIGVEELGFYKEDGSFVVEKGDFYIYVGKDSLDNNRVKINVC